MSLAANPLRNPKETKAARHRFYTSGLGPTKCPTWGKAIFFDFYEPCSECCEFFVKPEGNAMACKARIVNLKITEKRSFFGELSGGQKYRFFFENTGVQLI